MGVAADGRRIEVDRRPTPLGLGIVRRLPGARRLGRMKTVAAQVSPRGNRTAHAENDVEEARVLDHEIAGRAAHAGVEPSAQTQDLRQRITEQCVRSPTAAHDKR